MAGYADDWSMSNNAIDAYDRGLRPRSKWGKADILDALPANARTYLQLDEYPLEFLREYFLEVEEWHHTSKHYNRTDFCRPSIAHWSTSTPEDVQNLYIVWLQRQKKAQAMKTTDTRKVRVTYTHWIDKHTHKTVTEYALVRGSWIYTQSGLRKRADGTNIRVDETYKRAPRGTAQIFQEIERRMNGGGANRAKAGAQPVDDYYANKVRHHLQNKLRMTDADPAPVTAWAEAIGKASKAEKRVLERRSIEHHGVLVDGDGTICGYTRVSANRARARTCGVEFVHTHPRDMRSSGRASHPLRECWARLLVLPPEPCGRKDTRSRDIPGSRTGLCA